MDPTTADQRDHAIAAIPDSTRHNAYRRVVLEMAELLFQEEQADPPRGVLQDVTDLLDCYLMDLASIAATNDDRFLAAPFRAGSEPVREALAAAYQEYKARLWRDPAVSTQIKALLPPTKTADTVEQQYLAHMWRAAKGVFGAPSIRRR